jgi:hypothetical protein
VGSRPSIIRLLELKLEHTHLARGRVHCSVPVCSSSLRRTALIPELELGCNRMRPNWMHGMSHFTYQSHNLHQCNINKYSTILYITITRYARIVSISSNYKNNCTCDYIYNYKYNYKSTPISHGCLIKKDHVASP